MCLVCGCGLPDVPSGSAPAADQRAQAVSGTGTEHPHHHPHAHHHHHHSHTEDDDRSFGRGEQAPGDDFGEGDRGQGDLHFGLGLAGVSVAGMDQGRVVRIEQNILALNDAYAARNRDWLAQRGILALNLVSSPGAGKTSLLVRTIEVLRARMPIAVIEGDQQTTFDADRIRATGVPALQVNTGRGCHLDGHMIEHALVRLDPVPGSLLFIENVGNLVCPAGFDLGEAMKVLILSVTEGDDKPLKYPDMFAAAGLLVLTKTDLLPHVRFDVDRCLSFARQVNPDLEMVRVSAETGDGLAAWCAVLDRLRAQAQAQHGPGGTAGQTV